MIPHQLKDSLDEATALRTELRGSNQKLFSTVMVIGISAHTAEQLDQNIKRAMTVIRKQSCNAEIPSYMQLDAHVRAAVDADPLLLTF